MPKGFPYLIYCICIFLIQAHVVAQSPYWTNYTPVTEGDTAYKAIIARHLKERFNFLADSLSEHASKDLKKSYHEVFAGRYDWVKEQFDYNEVLYNDTITNFLNGILHKLVEANPSLAAKGYLLTKRTGVPNASSIGEGVILFNMGLLSRLRNEAEIAFVLGHELVHDKLDHVTRRMARVIETLKDKDFKNKVETASKSEYNNYHKVMELYKGLSFDFSKHSRDHEEQADSLGVLWMVKAGYDPAYALSALGLLDTIDKEKYREPIEYDKIFSSSVFIFKPEWLTGEDFMKGFRSKEEYTNDTFKTHPDCKIRVESVKRILKDAQYKGTAGKVLNDNFNLMADFEIIEHQYTNEVYGLSLYNTLHLLQLFPDNIYLKAMVVKNLYFLTKSLKEHNFSNHTDLPHPYFSKNYNEYLYLINNLRSSEFTSLANSFLKKQGTAINDPQYEFAEILCLSLTPEKVSLENLVADYAHKYPGSRETRYLTAKLITKPNSNNNPQKK